MPCSPARKRGQGKERTARGNEYRYKEEEAPVIPLLYRAKGLFQATAQKGNERVADHKPHLFKGKDRTTKKKRFYLRLAPSHCFIIKPANESRGSATRVLTSSDPRSVGEGPEIAGRRSSSRRKKIAGRRFHAGEASAEDQEKVSLRKDDEHHASERHFGQSLEKEHQSSLDGEDRGSAKTLWR